MRTYPIHAGNWVCQSESDFNEPQKIQSLVSSWFSPAGAQSLPIITSFTIRYFYQSITQPQIPYLIVFLLVFLGGCAISQEGAVDYRRAALSTKEARQDAANVAENNKSVGPTAPAALVRKYVASNAESSLIKKGDSISIRLTGAFIKSFWELGLFSPHRGFEANGEIAVVISAFEYNPKDKKKDFNFGEEGLKQGRLVFYSNDVEEDQFLNFSNMPVYGPITYNGYPIGLQITLLEVDANTQQMSALLTTLASVGASAYPPSSPILSVLDKLGGALLKGGSDDTEFKFTMLLDPPTPYTGLAYPRVEAGNYVFVRQNDRQENTLWNELVLDENSGRLYKTLPQSQEYRDNTYLTVQINSGYDSSGIDLSESTWGPFRDALEQIDSTKAAALKPVLDQITTMAFARVQHRDFIEARSKLNAFLDAKRKKPNDAGLAQRAAYELYYSLANAIKDLQSINDKPNPKLSEASLTLADTKLLLDRLRTIADARSAEDQKSFTIDGFLKSFPDTSDGIDAFFARIYHSPIIARIDSIPMELERIAKSADLNVQTSS